MQIADWLKQLGLSQYLPAFEANEITGALLPRLTAEDLKEIGVAAVGHRRILLDAIAALRSDAPAAPAPPDGADTAGERRQVTVLFADLVGFTRLSAAADPEDVRKLLDEFFELADRAVVDRGGLVDKHIGDCVMGVFGAPVAHHNDAERAVLAAIAIRDGLPALADRLGRPVDIHVGVASGEVVAGTGGMARREYTVTGESVNLASRLTDKATSGEILVSAEVRDIIGDRFVCEPAGDFALKGFAAPLKAWRLVGAAPAESASHRPFFGRAAEMRQFMAALDECLATGHGQAIFVRGDPGIGKTRLVEEFRQAAEAANFAVAQGIVLDFGGDKGRAAIAAIVRDLVELGTAETEPIEERLERSGLPVMERVLVADLLGQPLSDEEVTAAAAMDSASRSRHGREAVARLLARACARTPVMILVEDLHWADSATIDLVAALVETTATLPALLLATSRIEDEPFSGRLRTSSPTLTLDLGPLRREDARALAASYFGAEAEWIESCVSRAGGNPLFLDQLLQHVQAKAGGSVPTTIQSLVQARMDQLPPREKRALQTASVLGQRFDLPLLRHLLGDPGFDCDLLIQRHLLRRQGNGFIFSHALVRDAAYGTLLHERRRQLHKMAADWLADADRPLAAEHLAMAEDKAAPRACLEAATDLVERFRYEQALLLVDRGLSVAAEPEVTVALLLLRGEARLRSGDARSAIDAFTEARNLSDRPRDCCNALLGLASAKRILDEIDSSLADVGEAIALAERENLTREAARAFGLRGNLLFPRGDIEGCWRDHNRSLEMARAAGSAELETEALGGIGDAEYMRGRLNSAYIRFTECVSTATDHGLARVEAAYLPMQAISCLWTGNAQEAYVMALSAVEAARRIGHERAETVAHHGVALACRQLQRLAEGRDHVTASIALAERLKSTRFLAEGYAFLGEIALDQGDLATAREHFEKALKIGRPGAMAYIGPLILGGYAVVVETEEELKRVQAEAEALLAAGSASHNHMFYRQQMIGRFLDTGQWDLARHQAQALETYAAVEPTDVSRFIVARARALADLGEGRGGARKKLEDLAREATRLDRLQDRELIEKALQH